MFWTEPSLAITTCSRTTPPPSPCFIASSGFVGTLLRPGYVFRHYSVETASRFPRLISTFLLASTRSPRQSCINKACLRYASSLSYTGFLVRIAWRKADSGGEKIGLLQFTGE